jgi:hypothetical protein
MNPYPPFGGQVARSRQGYVAASESSLPVAQMTDQDAIEAALSAVDGTSLDHVLMRRNGRLFMALPANRDAAIRALNLYQPQRSKAVLAMFGIRLLAATGFHRVCLPGFHGTGGRVALEPEFPRCVPGTAGLMLGSPEHPVRRAILSYETNHGAEVAKLAFGEAGRKVVEGEYSALASIPTGMRGVPQALGVHHGRDFSLIRLPYLSGSPLSPGKAMHALDLLESWISDLPSQPVCDFPEWQAIRAALETSDAGKRALERLASIRLRPVVRHGDFARWNLLEMKDGSCVAIDWEWGHPTGMPGVDLVHLFAQDARLVHQLPPTAAVHAVDQRISVPRCRRYLEACGWGDSARDVMLASIAFTVGTKQQANEQVLAAALKW